MDNPKQQLLLSSANPSRRRGSCIKSRFTRGFLRALIRMMKRNYQNRPAWSSSSSRREIFRRYRRVKIAADKSMAVAVGCRRAWSRAMLWRIHQFQHRHHHQQAWRYRSSHVNHHQPTKKRLVTEKKQKKKMKTKKQEEEVGGFGEAKVLRKLVPGGEAMDLCSLLDETAHYIKCLVTQVQVMRRIDHVYSL